MTEPQQAANIALAEADAEMLVNALPGGFRKPLAKHEAHAFIQNQLHIIGVKIQPNPIDEHYDLTGSFQDANKRPLTLSLNLTDIAWTLLSALPTENDFRSIVSGANSVIGLHTLVTTIADLRQAPEEAQQGLDQHRAIVAEKAAARIPGHLLAVLEKSHANQLTQEQAAGLGKQFGLF